MSITVPKNSSDYESNLKTLKAIHHSQCLFNCNPPVPDFRLWFDDGGILFGEFTCTQDHQGYNGVAHGGLVAAIIDSSMVQCLMGHGVVGYTTDLSIKYRKPIVILQPTSLKIEITEIILSCLYNIKCEISQNQNLVVEATGKFLKAME